MPVLSALAFIGSGNVAELAAAAGIHIVGIAQRIKKTGRGENLPRDPVHRLIHHVAVQGPGVPDHVGIVIRLGHAGQRIARKFRRRGEIEIVALYFPADSEAAEQSHLFVHVVVDPAHINVRAIVRRQIRSESSRVDAVPEIREIVGVGIAAVDVVEQRGILCQGDRRIDRLHLR